MSDLEETLALLMRDAGLPEPVREYRFSPTRKFRLAMQSPAQKLGVEVQGGTWIKGGHTTGGGLERDYDKLNTASAGGWTVLMFSRKMIESGYAVEMIKQILGNGENMKVIDFTYKHKCSKCGLVKSSLEFYCLGSVCLDCYYKNISNGA